MAYIRPMTNEELKYWRAEHGYSQGTLAKALSVHIMTISKWERGIRELPPFLRLALRALELEGGEIHNKGGKKAKTKTRKEK